MSRIVKMAYFLVQFTPTTDKDQLVLFDSKFYAYFKILVAIPKIFAFASATGTNVNHFS